MKTIEAVSHFFYALTTEETLILIFILALLSEWLTGKIKRLNIHNFHDSARNIAIGAFSFVSDFIFSLLSLPLLEWLYRNHSLFAIPQGASGFCMLFLLVDLSEYWFHRLSHEINLLWAAHLVHHQSHCFNLSVGLRTSLFVPFFNIFIYALFPLIGFAPQQVLFVIFIQGIYQLLVHTELVKTLGVLEYIIVTPSAHRVHHGSNEIYLDKNYGKVFIFWDFLFCTYQRETESVSYGIADEEAERKVIGAVFDPYVSIVRFFGKEGNSGKRLKVLFGKPRSAKNMMQEKEISRS